MHSDVYINKTMLSFGSVLMPTLYRFHTCHNHTFDIFLSV